MLTVIRMKKLEKVTLMRRMLTILLLCLMSEEERPITSDDGFFDVDVTSS